MSKVCQEIFELDKKRKWRSCLFTDESTFLCLRSTGGIRVRGKHGVNRYDEKYIRKLQV